MVTQTCWKIKAPTQLLADDFYKDLHIKKNIVSPTELSRAPILAHKKLTGVMKNQNKSVYPADTLGMDSDEMRRLGYQMVDMVVDRLQAKHELPALKCQDRQILEQQLGGSVPELPMDPQASLKLLAEVALSNQQNGDHPRYFARVAGPSSYAAVLGEWMGTGFNAVAISWGGGSGPTTIELIVLNWLRQLLGLPEGSEGILLSGGSMANTTAFSVARSQRGMGRVYFTDQAHSSLPRSLKELGFGEDYLCLIPSDDSLKMPVDALRAAIEEDIASDYHPMMVIATAGTTNTGTVDPLNAIADLCEKYNLWFHVDGAYGAPAAITKQGKTYLDGITRADSLVLDPHKWFFQPYDVGCLLVRHPGALQACFDMNPEYLKDVQAQGEDVDMRNRSLELTRRARGLKLWMSLRTYGAAKFRHGIEQGIRLAEYAEYYLRQHPTCWEVVSPAQIGIVCFALRNVGEGEHERRAKRITDSGFACVSSTQLKHRSVLRLCILNPLTTEWDIRETLDRLAAEDLNTEYSD